MKCAVCGRGFLEQKRGDFRTEFVERNGETRPLIVPNVNWQECDTCHEAILDDEASSLIEESRRKAEGLLTPGEIRQLRRNIGLTQTEMSGLLGIGDKTYCRWESGAYVQSIAMDRYLRLLISLPENIAILQRLESGTELTTAVAEPIARYDVVFTRLQHRESLLETADVFTELFVTGQLQVPNPEHLVEV